MKIKWIAFFLFICSRPVCAQDLDCDNPLIKDAWKLAVQTVDINTRRGILAAGGDYGGEWTRDISINSWNGASLLRPSIAENSLWSVTLHKDTIGHQYWDKIIWAVAAWNHYLVTGNKTFLAQAYICSVNTMNQQEQKVFDKKYGLFNGPSVFNDGIAAYPEPIYEPGNFSSSVLDHKNSFYIKCLSTNCLYYGALRAIIHMGESLGENSAAIEIYRKKAAALKDNILKHFYNKDRDTFYYLVDQNGKTADYQEALGISFATIFGVCDSAKASAMIGHAFVSRFGITSVYPDLPRYSKDRPGRHNNIVWPMVNGFYAQAAISAGCYQTFSNELFNAAHLALDEDKGNYNFREIYNPYTGKPDGGFQDNGKDHPDFHWESCHLQTWSATAYISMLINGLFGLTFHDAELTFSPFLPQGISFIQLHNLAWRNCLLDITIKGNGRQIRSFLLDGRRQTDNFLSATLTGKHSLVVEMNDR